MENIFGSVHYNSIAVWMKKYFGKRMVKLSIDGGFTCPNRDGTCGTGGCIYCSESGSGDFASDIANQICLTRRKWPDAGYLAYFQNHTNTYAPVETLRKKWDSALSRPGISGLAIATRPDCLQDDIVDLLAEYQKKTFLWVELGLQTESDKTAELINRCYKTEVFADAMERLKQAGIRVVVHEILGLPGEDRQQMLKTASFVNAFEPFGIKLHMMHVMKGTRLGEIYEKQQCKTSMDTDGGNGNKNCKMSMDADAENGDSVKEMNGSDFPEIILPTMKEYVETVVKILENTPQSITIHRLTGDAPGKLLIAPEWTRNKHVVLGAIQHEFSVRGSYQGSGCRQ